MKAKRNYLSSLAAAGVNLLFLLLPAASIRAQETSVPAPPNERLEIKYSQPQLLELELSRYLTTDVRKRRSFEVTATVVEAIRTEKGVVVIPAQTKIRLTAMVRPGKKFGHAGEMVLWIDPFLIGKGIEGYQCEPAARLLPQLCQDTWRLSFDHQLDYAATPETGNPMIFDRKKHHEGITGTRSSRPANFVYDQSGSNADARIQTAANRYQAAGIIYEIGAAFTGAVRFIFSKRNLFLPSGSRVIFKLENKLRLVPAADSDVEVIRFDTPSRKRQSKRAKAADSSDDEDDK